MYKSLTIELLQAREVAMAFFRPILKQYNLTEQQWRVIRILADVNVLDFHELSDQACILRPSLTGILSRMEREDLVSRFKPMNDQRKLYLSLTPKGQALYQQAKVQIEHQYKEIETRFPSEKMTLLLTLLAEFIAIGHADSE